MADDLGSVGSTFIEIRGRLSKLPGDFDAAKAVARTGSSEIASSMSPIGDAAAAAGVRIKEMGDSFRSFGSVAQSAGIALTAAFTAPVLAVAGLGISFNAMSEQAKIGFTTLLGSAGLAQAKLTELKDFAAKTPFQFPELVVATQRMLAYGFAADKITPMLRSIGDATAALGGGAEVMNRLIVAMGQIQAKGHLATQEMNQIAETGIPAWQLLADKLGISIPEAMARVEKGAVSAGVAIAALTEGMDQRFAGSMENQSQSFSGLMSTIADESRFLAGAMTDGLFNAIKGPLTSLTNAMHGMRSEVEGWSSSTKVGILAVGLLVAAVGPALLVLGSLASSIVSITAAYGLITGATVTATTATVALAPTVVTTTAALTAGDLMAGGYAAKLMSLAAGSTTAAAGQTALGAATVGAGTIFATWTLAIGLAAAAIYKTVDAYFAAKNAQAELADNLTTLQSSTERAAKSLKDNYGKEIQQGTMSTEKFGEVLGQAAHAAAVAQAPIVALAAAHAEATKAQKEELDKLTASFTSALKPADDLNVELFKMMLQFRDSETVAVYGKQILQAAAAQREHGLMVTGAVAALEQLALKYRNAATAASELEAQTKRSNAAHWSLIDTFSASLHPAAELQRTLFELSQEYSKSDILKIYAGQIVDLTDKELKLNGRLSEGMAKWREWALSAHDASTAVVAAVAAVATARTGLIPTDPFNPTGLVTPQAGPTPQAAGVGAGAVVSMSGPSGLAPQPSIPANYNIGSNNNVGPVSGTALTDLRTLFKDWFPGQFPINLPNTNPTPGMGMTAAQIAAQSSGGASFGSGVASVATAGQAAVPSIATFSTAVDKFVAQLDHAPSTFTTGPIQVESKIEVNLNGAPLTDEDIYDKFLPKLTRALTNNTRGVARQWGNIFSAAQKGSVSNR